MSTEIAGISTWEVLNQSAIGSDHYPIITRIGVEIHQDNEVRTPRWKLDKADWQSFQMLSEVKCVDLLNKNITEVKEMNENVVTAIIEAAEETIPKKAGSKLKKCVPWWDESCNTVIKKRNKMSKQLKIHHTLETLINYKRAQAVVRKTIRSAKRVYWRQFCNTIGRETQLPDIWRTIRKMSGIRNNVEIPVLCSNNKNAISNAEKAELFVKTFDSQFWKSILNS